MEQELHLNPLENVEDAKTVKFDLGSKREAKVITGIRRSKNKRYEQDNTEEHSDDKINIDHVDGDTQTQTKQKKPPLWLKHDSSYQVLIQEDDREQILTGVAVSEADRDSTRGKVQSSHIFTTEQTL